MRTFSCDFSNTFHRRLINSKQQRPPPLERYVTFLSYVTGSVHTLSQEKITQSKNDNSSYRCEYVSKLLALLSPTNTHKLGKYENIYL
jgi:hypothetical protein